MTKIASEDDELRRARLAAMAHANLRRSSRLRVGRGEGRAMLNAPSVFRRFAVSTAALACIATAALTSPAGIGTSHQTRAFHPAAILVLSPSQQARQSCAAVGATTGEAGVPDADASPNAALWACPKAPPHKPKFAVPKDYASRFAAL